MRSQDNHILKVSVGGILPALFLCLLVRIFSNLPVGSILKSAVELRTAIIPSLLLFTIVKYITEVLWQTIQAEPRDELINLFEKEAILCVIASLIDIYLSAKQ